MTVKELREQLKEFPQNFEVELKNFDYGMSYEVDSVKLNDDGTKVLIKFN